MTKAKVSDRQPAEGLPVARVCVDVPLPHLDRLFDYQVPSELDDAAQPGVRVKIRFSGKLADGWLIERVASTEHLKKLAWLEKVVSPEAVLRPSVVDLAREIAHRYAGSLADVLRMAVPPRQAAVEKQTALSSAGPSSNSPAGSEAAEPQPDVSPGTQAPGSEPDFQAGAGASMPPSAASTPAPGPAGAATGTSRASSGAAGLPGAADLSLAMPAPDGWSRYPAGPAWLKGLAEGRSPRAVWSALPGEDWPLRYAESIAATLQSGRGAVVVVADARDLSRLDAALTGLIGAGHHVALSAALGPAERYRRFLRVSRGEVRAVIGTRAASFAPAENLGLVAIWDDGDDVHAEPRAPYPHARQVLLTRSQQSDAAVLVGGFARTAEAQQLLSTGWAKEVAASRDMIRVAAPEVQPADDNQLARDPAAVSARLPSVAWNAARAAIKAEAPVLVQVPRRGYVPAVSCQDCRERARCPHCAGPLTLGSAGAVASCRWCARPAAGYQCPACGGRRLRAAITGVRRTAEELGRALPGVPVMTSGGDNILDRVPDGPALVLATPGAEPVAEHGYGAVLLLDSWALLTRADLRAGEEAARRWFQAAALAKPASAGGRVVVVADGGLAQVQALIRWDPGWLAERELAERRALRFPPAAQLAALTGVAAAVSELLDACDLPEGAEVLGPLPVAGDQERMLVRVRRAAGPALAAALHAAAGVRSARKAADPVRIQLDPQEL